MISSALPVRSGSAKAATLAATVRMVAAAACWGLSAVFAKHAFARGVAPARMAEARPLVALAGLLPLLVWRWRRHGRPLLPPAGTMPLLIGFGLCVAAVNESYYLAIDHLPVGVAISLQYTGPVLVLAVAALLRRRLPGGLVWAAAALTLAGTVLVSGAYQGLGAVDGVGLAAGLASAGLFAAYLLCAEGAGRRGVEPALVLLWGFVAAVALWSAAAPWWSWPFAALHDPAVVLAVLGVGLVGTLLPFFLAVGAVRVLAASTAGIAAAFEPVFAAGFAWLLLGEQLAATQLAGGVLVVAGVALAQVVLESERSIASPRSTTAAQLRSRRRPVTLDSDPS